MKYVPDTVSRIVETEEESPDRYCGNRSEDASLDFPHGGSEGGVQFAGGDGIV